MLTPPLALVGLIQSPWARRAAVVFLGLACIASAYWFGRRSGSSEAHAQDALRSREALEIVDREYRAREVEHARQIESLRLGFARVDATEGEKDRTAVSDLAGGAKRVRVRVARCAPASDAATPTPGANAAATAELPPEVGARLYQLAADADATARQLGALQAWATEAVKLCNGGKP